jgi:hypothetical protein
LFRYGDLEKLKLWISKLEMCHSNVHKFRVIIPN